MRDRIPLNIKKVRGWPRRVKQLDHWGKSVFSPDLESFEKYGRTYERCYLDPWYRFVKRNPPVWYFRKVVGYFDAAFENWEKVFSKQDEPYDLQLWLFSTAWISSEIYCGKVNVPGETTAFFERSEVQKTFPVEIFGDEVYDKYNWELCDDVVYHDEEDVLEWEGSLESLQEKGYIAHVNPDGHKYYTIKIGEVWIGRMKQ